MPFLSRDEDPETGEAIHRCMAAAPEGLLPPHVLHGLSGDPFVFVEVGAAALRLERGWVFSSGQMDHYETDAERRFERGPDGWPPEAEAAVTAWCEPDLARQVIAVLRG